jgi:hypothetical protein
MQSEIRNPKSELLPMLAGLGAFAVIAGGSFILFYVIYAGPHSKANPEYFTQSQWVASFPPLNWRLPWWLLKIHAGNMLAYPFGGENFASTGTLLLVIAGCVRLVRRGRGDLLLLLLAPLAMAFIAALLRRYPYGTSARTMLFMAPAFCILAAVGARWGIELALGRLRARLVSSCRHDSHPTNFTRKNSASVGIAAIALAVIAIGALGVDIARPYRYKSCQQIRAAIRDVARQTAPGDQWIVTNAPDERADAPQVGGDDCQVFRYYVATLAPVPVQWAPPMRDIFQKGPAAGRTWLLMHTDSDFDREQADGPWWLELFFTFDKDRSFRTLWQEAYVKAAISRLGTPQSRRIALDHGNPRKASPTITIYEFPPTGGS